MTMWRWLTRFRTRPTPARPRPARATIWVCTGLLDRTAELLQKSGGDHEAHEGVAYWAGHRVADECFVTTCIAPAATTTRGSFDTTAHANANVVMCLASSGLELIGQVHSHPGRFVDHSDGDDERALMPYDGFLSVVVPHYARRGMRPFTVCGVHVFESAGFRRLADSEIQARFRVVDDFVDLRA